MKTLVAIELYVLLQEFLAASMIQSNSEIRVCLCLCLCLSRFTRPSRRRGFVPLLRQAHVRPSGRSIVRLRVTIKPDKVNERPGEIEIEMENVTSHCFADIVPLSVPSSDYGILQISCSLSDIKRSTVSLYLWRQG
jgi:hypothetical protein